MLNKNTVGKVLRKTWQIWFVVFSFLLGMGIVQVNFITLNVPDSWKVYIVFGFVLLSLVIIIFVLLYENTKLTKQVAMLENDLAQSGNPFIFLIEGIPIYALITHLTKRKSGELKNPVYLDLLKLDIKVHGQDKIKDATLAWRFKGKNTSDDHLTGFFMSIASENATPFSEIQRQVCDLTPDGSREGHRLPRLVADDSNHKDLQLPFQVPGIPPYGSFDIEFTYTWPNIVNPKKDYWFVEPRRYANTVDKLILSFDYPTKDVKEAMMFELSLSDKKVVFLGTLKVTQAITDHFQFETEKVAMGKVYLAIVETND